MTGKTMVGPKNKDSQLTIFSITVLLSLHSFFLYVFTYSVSPIQEEKGIFEVLTHSSFPNTHSWWESWVASGLGFYT